MKAAGEWGSVMSPMVNKWLGTYILLVGTLLLIATLSGCGDNTPAPSTATPIVIYMVITPTALPATATMLPSATTSVRFQSGGLGLTEQEWKVSGSSNAPKVPSADVAYTEGRVSSINITYGGEGVDGRLAPITQARAESKKLLPKDAVVVAEGRIYQHQIYIVGVDTYTSLSLAQLFEATPDVWQGSQSGIFNVEYALYGNNDQVGNMYITLGRQGPILKDFGIDPDAPVATATAATPLETPVAPTTSSTLIASTPIPTPSLTPLPTASVVTTTSDPILAELSDGLFSVYEAKKVNGVYSFKIKVNNMDDARDQFIGILLTAARHPEVKYSAVEIQGLLPNGNLHFVYTFLRATVLKAEYVDHPEDLYLIADDSR